MPRMIFRKCLFYQKIFLDEVQGHIGGRPLMSSKMILFSFLMALAAVQSIFLGAADAATITVGPGDSITSAYRPPSMPQAPVTLWWSQMGLITRIWWWTSPVPPGLRRRHRYSDNRRRRAGQRRHPHRRRRRPRGFHPPERRLRPGRDRCEVE